jgi:hypothetical protein
MEEPYFGNTLAKERILGNRRDWSRFKQKYPNSGDTTLYRLFKKSPYKFWRWEEYLFNWRYRLPYKNWEDIRMIRGYDLQYSNNFQGF